ncbi:MAG: type II toxin-antitoxin system Phd/YefM family antitoxin [Candidatus Latescibacter sp.]|nr:type II toxin-antitoxin system Phd/YefM family antitoxin [Candidatus Latescibacter sp.]
MKLSDSVKPISYLKAHASEILRDVASNQKTVVITQNGEAKAILQDIRVYEQTQESLALLKIISLSKKNIEKGNIKTIEQSFKDIRKRIKENQNEM